jgi:hypothetical protein
MTIRRKFICDAVDYYKRNNVEDYSKFLDIIEFKRSQLEDPKYAKLVGATEFRQLGTLPKQLADQLYYVLDGVSEPRFLEKEGETKWFFKKFPEFLIPRNY